MKKTVSFLLLVFCFLTVFCFKGYYKILQADPQEGYTYNAYRTVADKQYTVVKIPNELDFAGEQIPTHDPKVRQKFSEEYLGNSYWLLPSIFGDPERSRIYSKSLSILKEKKIPQDFIYLLLAESSLKNSVSNKGAAGVWQLMPDAARAFGLQVDDNVDERYDYVKSTYAACEYLKDAHNELGGDWTLAAASYNMGVNGLSRRLGGDANKTFFDLYLNSETSRYIYKILAIKVAMKNPKKYDYYQLKYGKDEEKMLTFKIDSTIEDLSAFAEARGYDIFMLKKYNPWLVSNRLPTMEGKTYTISFPNTPYIKPEPVVPAIYNDTQKVSSVQKMLLH